MVIMILLGILSGVTIVWSRIVNAKLSEYVGPYQSTFFNFFIGLLAAILIALVTRSAIPKVAMPQGMEWLMYLGGILGVGSVFIFNVITKHLPAYELTLIVFVASLFAGMVIDYLLYDMFSIGKLLGGALVIAGLYISTRGDKKQEN